MMPIVRGTLIFIGLVMVSAIFLIINTYYPFPYLEQIAVTVLAIAVIYLLVRVLFENITLERIRDPRTRYSFRKGVSLVFIIIVLVIAAVIWVESPEGLLVSYGLIGAGIAIALQDVFKNLAGGIFIFTSRIYSVGDRVEIKGMYGDVIDISLWNTTLMEIQGWVSGDQPTGRITLIPNEVVVTHPVFNYTKDYNFIWDEITVPITYESDWKGAIALFLGIVREERQAMTALARQEIEEVGEKYYLPRGVVEPSVFLTLTDNWITCSIRYVTAVRERRLVRDRLSRMILEAISTTDAIQIASETLTLSGSHRVTLQNNRDMSEPHGKSPPHDPTPAPAINSAKRDY